MMKKRGINGVLLILLCLIMGFGISVPAMAASKKPATPKLVSVKQAGANAVTVSWAKAKNAKQYELFVAVNKGSYKKLKTSKELSFRHTGVKAGATYKYKVRAVNGNSKSAFSKTKSVKIKKGSGSAGVLSVNVKTVTLKPNQTEKVVVTFTQDGEVEFDIGDESIVECEWQGKWYGGGDLINLAITGKKPGSTVVKISNDYNGETCSIKVNVKGNTIEGNYAHLKTVILNSDLETEEGNPCISYSNSGTEYNIIYETGTGAFNFFMLDESASSTTYYDMYIDDSALRRGSANIEFSTQYKSSGKWVEATTTIPFSSHTVSSKYNWNQTGGDRIYGYQISANMGLGLAFLGWNLALIDNAELTMKDLGFSSF